MARNQANTGKKEQAAERRIFVLERRKAGASIREIELQWAKYCEKKNSELGSNDYQKVSHNQIHKDLTKCLSDLSAEQTNMTAELRQLEAERLDGLQVQFWMLAMGQFDSAERKWIREPNIKSGDLILKIMKRRADLLGLDSPQKVEIEGEVKNVQMTVTEWRAEREKRREQAAKTQELFDENS